MNQRNIIILTLFISSLVSSKHTWSQDLLNQYSFIQPIILPINLTKNLNSLTANAASITWVNPQANPFPSYNGEYEILMRSDWLFWNQYASQGFGFGLAVSYNIEVVSFPFTPDCMKDINGCGAFNTNLGRNLIMPSDPYDQNNNNWDLIKRKIPPSKFGLKGSSLTSFVYAVDNPLANNSNRNYFPHTILKHTIGIHCEVNSAGNPTTPPIYKFSWLHDNTRGRMKYYPFCPNGDANCDELQYDVCFNPRILHKSPTHAYNETQTNAILPVTGTINYFDYNDIINSNCNLSSIVTLYPLPNWLFYNSGYIRAYFPPYTLVTAPLYQSEGRVIAGYESDPIITNQFNAMYGVKQNYTINSNIDIVNTEISESDRIFYNPSDVTITATDLHFPSNYSFRTIRGVYPSPAEVAADNTAINGGPFNDPRDVPVRTDLRCEDAAFPDDASIPDHSKYASLYRLAAGSKLTLEPCVRVFDAAFILNPGSTLELANKTSIIGLHRVAIDRNGGRLIEKYELNSGTLYLQDKNETALAPNSYYVNSKIFAGENVDVTSPVGPYIASTGSNLELIARDYIKLDHGFHAEAGADVKIQIDPALQIPSCPPPASGGSGNRFANLATNSIVDATAHIKLLPTLFTNSTGIYSENKNEDPIISIEVLDASGKKIKQINEINDYFVEVDLASLNDGMYFFIIQTNKNRKVLKGVKQN